MDVSANYETRDNNIEGNEFLKEETIYERIVIPNENPDIKKILSSVVYPEVENIRVIKTEKGLSNEGQRLLGAIVIVGIKLKQKITYVSDNSNQAIHVIYNESFKSMPIIVPEEVNSKSIEALLRLNKITAEPYVENVYEKVIDKRNIFSSILLFTKIKLR